MISNFGPLTNPHENDEKNLNNLTAHFACFPREL